VNTETSVYDALTVSTAARYQVANAGLAVTAAELLIGALDARRVRAALASVVVPGRLQVVARDPLLLADGAHNPHGVRALAETLRGLALPRPFVAVMAIMRDKDVAGMLRTLLPLVDAVVCTQASEPRGLTADELAQRVAGATEREPAPGAAGKSLEVRPTIHVVADPHEAVTKARGLVGAKGAILVTGSLYLLEDLHDLLESSQNT
jgi:dihydrofolate synthase/folylpolyglutamate synthase